MSEIVDKVKKPAVNVSFHASGNHHFRIYGENFNMLISADMPDDVYGGDYVEWELKDGEEWEEL